MCVEEKGEVVFRFDALNLACAFIVIGLPVGGNTIANFGEV